MPNDEELIFRSDNEERLNITERNKKAATNILEKAGIDKNNPLYDRYYAYTMANVHNAGRYGVYDDAIEQMFVETLKNPELSIEQYLEATKKFQANFAEKQLRDASGSIFNETKNNTPYSEIRSILNETTKSGIEMREEFGTSFPKDFYDESGKLRSRLVVDIPPELFEDSAMGIIGMTTKKYSSIEFDKKKNAFIVKGKQIGPEKFFKNKIGPLDKFDPNMVDMEDKELFDIIQKGDYNSFLELCKERGIKRNKTNETLRNALKDEVAFNEVSEKLRTAEITKDNLISTIKGTAEDFASKAETIRTEAEKGVLGSIDRVMFSVSPADVARQSTFQDWKSCMHAVGLNHRFVDDSIGVGSIVAYGYSSANPQKMVSRLLIHPYTNDVGEIAYGVNNRIYGKENLAFRQVVDKVVKDKFNKGKYGVFEFNKGKEFDERGKLYNDDETNKIVCANYKNGDIVDLNKYVINGVLDLEDIDLSRASGIIYPKCYKKFINIKVPSNIKSLDLSDCDDIDLKGADLSNVEDLKLPSRIKSLEGTKLPKKLRFE